MRPLVSICIPTFKRYDQLQKCIENALGQDYENIEVLVSDDTQDESTPDWLLSLSVENARLRYVRQPFTLGIVENNRFVRDNAKGDFFCIMHNDDTFPRNYVSKMMEMLENDSNCVLAGPSCSRYMEDVFWYDYECFSNYGLNQFERLKDIIIRAFENPWAFEHLMYGVSRRDVLPGAFHFGHWRSIIVFFFLYSIRGNIRTVKDVRLTKNTTYDDIKKYASANYVKRYSLITHLFSHRQEERMTVLVQLVRFTFASKHICLLDKLHLVTIALLSYLQDKQEQYHAVP